VSPSDGVSAPHRYATPFRLEATDPLTTVLVRALLGADVTPPSNERERLISVLAALEDKPRAADLASDDPALGAAPSTCRTSR
jgi:hypothetical protein